MVGTIEELVARLAELEPGLPPSDGVLWFHRLYREVTDAIVAHLDELEDPAFLTGLAVVYGNDYLRALAHPAACDHAWRPLFAARRRDDVAPLQFALAGLNAHVNHDVPVGLAPACVAAGVVPSEGGTQHRDYTRMTTLLRGVEERVKAWLVTGALELVDRTFAPLDDTLAMWSLEAAREAAWVHGEVLYALGPEPPLASAYADVLDRTAGFAGRGLLIPTALDPSTA